MGGAAPRMFAGHGVSCPYEENLRASSMGHGAFNERATQWRVITLWLSGRLLGICEAGVAHQNRLHLVRGVCNAFRVDETEAARSETLVRAGILLIVDRFATRTGRVVPLMVSTTYSEPEFLVSHVREVFCCSSRASVLRSAAGPS